MKLTSRDVEILKFINEFGFCEMPQINQRFSLRKPRNYQVINKLVRHNLLQHERIFYKQHGLFRLTQTGARFTKLPPLHRVPLANYQHDLSLLNLYLKLRILYPDATWISERKLKHDKPLDEREIKIIEDVIEGLYRLDLSERQFCHIAPFFGKNSKGSLRARFECWHSGREHAWVFDHENDCFEQQQYETEVIGLDLTHILKDEVCKTPMLMYLLHRFSQQLEGQRGMIFLDEGWLALQDEYFKHIINDLSRTPRKKNNCFGLATQAAHDTSSSAIQAPINEAAACKIFFPNPMADRKTYIEGFGLIEREFGLIKTLPDDSHYFLLNYGRGKESVVLRANLQGLEDEIAVISGRKETVELLDTIRVEVGNDPRVWLPIFQQRRKKDKIVC